MIQNKWVLILDFDSTLISTESLDLLSEVCLKSRQDSISTISKIKDLTNKGMIGDITFYDSLIQRLKYLDIKNCHLDQLVEKLFLLISPTIKKNQAWLKKNRMDIFIFSGGFKRIIDPIAFSLGLKIDQVYGNDFTFSNDGSINGVNFKNPLSQSNGKFLLAKNLDIKKKIIMVGDGMTDSEIKQLGSETVFIAYTENIYRNEVVDIADYKAETFDDVIHFIESIK